MEGGIISLSDLVKLFSTAPFRKRLEPDYFTHREEYMAEFITTMMEIGKTGPYWLG
jgi:hypothetical protein